MPARLRLPVRLFVCSWYTNRWHIGSNRFPACTLCRPSPTANRNWG